MQNLDFHSKVESAETIAIVLGRERTKEKQDKDNGNEKNRKFSN